MSGIYGIADLRKKIDEKSYKRLLTWNFCYGNSDKTEGSEAVTNGSFAFRCGVSREYFKEALADGKALIEDEKSIGVYDTLLYDRGDFKSSKEVYDEAFLHSILKDGKFENLKTINGDFAGAFYDKEKSRLYLFRDHMGSRPLYYYARNGLFVFSTDLRGITCVEEVDAHINEEWLYKTLSSMMYMNLDRTEYEYIYSVPSGAYVTVDFNEKDFLINTHRYWTPGKEKVRFSTDEEYYKRLRELTEDAIKIRLDAVEGKVGAELSGGLDSSVISILINRLKRECSFFSWGGDIETRPLVENDERLPIFDICKQEGIECEFSKCKYDFKGDYEINRRIPLDLDDKDQKRGPYIRYAFPPFMNGYPMVETAEHMRKNGVRVIFTGHAGDEGISHRCMPYELFYYKEYIEFLRCLWRRSYRQKNRVKHTLKNAAFYINYGHKQRTQTYVQEVSRGCFMNPDFVEKGKTFKAEKMTFAFDPKYYIRKGGSRNRLNVVSLVGALCGVRYIAPYVDYRLIDFALGIPRYLYLNGFQNRYIYRMAFKDIMPESLFDLQNKREVSVLKESEAGKNEQTEKKEVTKEELERIKTSKRTFVYNVNREDWEKYLDYDLLEKWIEGETGDDFNEEGLYAGHTFIEMAENMVIKSRQVKIRED